MSIVTLSTIYHTLFISVLLLLCKGWSYARSNLARDDLSTITLVMGAVYLIYSAYYVAVNIEGIQFMMTLLLNSLYLMLMVIVMKNAVETRRLLKNQQKQIYENNVEPLMPSINLKVKLINHFIIVVQILRFRDNCQWFDPHSTISKQLKHRLQVQPLGRDYLTILRSFYHHLIDECV